MIVKVIIAGISFKNIKMIVLLRFAMKRMRVDVLQEPYILDLKESISQWHIVMTCGN